MLRLIPNIITMFRIVLVPALVMLLLSEQWGRGWTAWALFVLAALSDMADGVLARRLNLVSQFGRLIDPIADKILVMSVLVCLVELRAISAWIVILILAREMAMSGFRILASDRGITIPSSRLGKIKMWVVAITLGMLILGEPVLQEMYVLAEIGVWITLAIVWISALTYFLKHGRDILKEGSCASR